MNNGLDLLRKELQKDWVEVNFKKKGGSTRNMVCTTNMELIPEESHPKKKTEDTINDKDVKESTAFTVYEKDVGWRSFKNDSIIDFVYRYKMTSPTSTPTNEFF